MQAGYDGRTWRGSKRGLRGAALGLGAALALGIACSDDEPRATQCIGGDGAVAGTPEPHCQGPDGAPVVRAIGACVSGGAEDEEHDHEGESADAGSDEHEDGEEEHAINVGRGADDDDCKYHVSFTNTCVAVNQPVTFTLSLTRTFDGMPGSGTNPAFPEIYLAEDASHISPSNDISASEGPAGTYAIGPIVFDRSGRWVIRFHYFEDCSDIPADSPHGHAAFYIDVP